MSTKEQVTVDRKELIKAAYKASGYSPTNDYLVLNDRYRGLEKLSDEKLNEIINRKK